MQALTWCKDQRKCIVGVQENNLDRTQAVTEGENEKWDVGRRDFCGAFYVRTGTLHWKWERGWKI